MLQLENPARRRAAALSALLASIGLLATPAMADDALLERFAERTTVHVLKNGWTFVLCERPGAPVFSFATLADVGSAQEVPGITGLAHMFEHMAFKGTPNIGSRDYAAEKLALEAVEEAYQAYERARHDPAAEPAAVEALLAEFRARQEKAAEYVVVNEFANLVEREGGTGLNASTDRDFTSYFYSLPANKLELFAFLESERFLHPVFREFYKERDVVQEERRLNTDSHPIGRLLEQAISTAYVAHPYKQPTIGYMSDLQAFTARDAEAFFREHYVPANLVTALVGQFDTQKVVPVLEKYFGRLPAGPKPPPLRTIEPPQIAEKSVVLVDPSQPVYAEMYHRPSVYHPDHVVYEAIHDVLSNGRTSRLYRALVRDQKIAAFVSSLPAFPGIKYPSLWLIYGIPARGQDGAAIAAAAGRELARLTEEPVSEAELQRFKTRAKADLLRQLRWNPGLAEQLALHQVLFGDWRRLFRYVEQIDAVTQEDIQRVARETFVAKNRTSAVILTAATPSTPQENDDATR